MLILTKNIRTKMEEIVMKVIKKKNLLKKLAVTTAVTCVVALSISACGKKNKVNENQDPLTGQDTSQSSEAASEGGSDGENGEIGRAHV